MFVLFVPNLKHKKENHHPQTHVEFFFFSRMTSHTPPPVRKQQQQHQYMVETQRVSELLIGRFRLCVVAFFCFFSHLFCFASLFLSGFFFVLGCFFFFFWWWNSVLVVQSPFPLFPFSVSLSERLGYGWHCVFNLWLLWPIRRPVPSIPPRLPDRPQVPGRPF